MGANGLTSWALPALQVAALALFFSLDLRDLYFKVVWLGSANSFGFDAVGLSTLDSSPLAPAAHLNLSTLVIGDEVNFLSGWPSLLAKCEALYAPDNLFLHARATECLLGIPGHQFHANDLYLVASARVDAVAWAACKLVYLYRRPPLCQENVVTEFVQRYRLTDPVAAAAAMAEPNSAAERELLDLLDLLGRSYPLRTVVCLEAIQVGDLGQYPAATLVGCASPNVFDAVFVGLHAPAFLSLHRDKAFLTLDALNVMGMEFAVRQNSKSAFVVGRADDGAHTVAHHTEINFSSFGHLYILVVAIDLVLLAAHARSALETSTVLLLPLLGSTRSEDVAHLSHAYGWTILFRSLYRSPPIVALTLLSGLLSWQLQTANSIIWTWNESSAGKLHAVLSSARVWMVVICVLNLLWGVVVATSETRAYRFVKRAYLTTFEVLLMGTGVAVLEQKRTFAVSGEKYAVDGQRLWDADSFPGHTAYANSFNEALDYQLSTPMAVLSIVYSSMLSIVAEALLVAVVYLGLKFAYFSVRRRTDALMSNDSDGDEMAKGTYQRLPLEELLRVPVRAQSLVRNSFQVEMPAQQQRYIPPSIYFDFGVILDNDIIRTRRGFFNVIHLKVDVAQFFSPAAGGSKSSVASMPSDQMRRPSSFLSGAAPSSPSSSTRPPSTVTSPLPRSMNGKAVFDAVVATDGVGGTAPGKEGEGGNGRRPLAETVSSPASRSMRRRKSITELAAPDDMA